MKRSRRGFTLVELLVVIAIIGILVSLLLPAIQGARESVRRSACTARLAQLILAVQSYEMAHEVFPSGVVNETGPVRNVEEGYHMGWIPRILPFFEETNLYNHIDFSKSVYDPAHAKLRESYREFLMCPSYGGLPEGRSNYAACHHDQEAPIDADQQGVMFLNSRIRAGDIRDGTSYTIFLGETGEEHPPSPLDNLGWMSGTRATLRNTGLLPNEELPQNDELLSVGGFGSHHTARLTMFAFGDGHVRALSPEIDADLYRSLGNRADGKLIDTKWME